MREQMSSLNSFYCGLDGFYGNRFMVEEFLRYSPKFLEPIIFSGDILVQSETQIDAISKVVAIAEKRLRDHRYQALKSIRIVDEDYRPIEQRRFKISEEESVYIRELQSILSPESCLGVAMTYELKSYIEDLGKYIPASPVRLDIPIELLRLFED